MSAAILIIDDEPQVLRSLKRLLRRDGYEIHLAEGGRAALQILEETDIAVIICDQRMPEMSGAEVLAESYKLSPNTRRITLTGFTDLTAAQASINEGHVHRFLLKPWDDDHMRSVVADAVSTYQLQVENRRLEQLTREQKQELETWNTRLEAQVQERTKELQIQNRKLIELQQCIEQSLRDTVGVLVGTLEAHSPNLGIHTKRVTQFSRQLASQLDLNEERVREIEFAASLHDIGKLARDRVSGRSKRMVSSAKFNEPNRHPESGYAILSTVAGFKGIASSVRHQHERFDGSGLPDGLTATEIPLAARIIAVANTYDKAVYPSDDSTLYDPDKGREALIQASGSHLDPKLAELFLAYVDQLGVATIEDAEVELSPRRLKPGMVISRPLLDWNGVLLLKEKSSLTEEMIARIRGMSETNMLLAGVHVHCGFALDGHAEVNAANATASIRHDSAEASHNAPQLEMTPPSQTGLLEQNLELPSQEPAVTQIESRRSTEESLHDALNDRTLPSDDIDQDDSAQAIALEPRRARAIRKRASKKSLAEAQTPRKKVLIVDDSALVCNALKRELRSAGIDSILTDSGWSALSLVKQGSFDAVLLDLMMPAMSGEELVERLQDSAPTLPCIILTGNATKGSVVTLSNAPNVKGILTKPWESRRLKQTIASVLAQAETNLESTPEIATQ